MKKILISASLVAIASTASAASPFGYYDAKFSMMLGGGVGMVNSQLASDEGIGETGFVINAGAEFQYQYFRAGLGLQGLLPEDKRPFSQQTQDQYGYVEETSSSVMLTGLYFYAGSGFYFTESFSLFADVGFQSTSGGRSVGNCEDCQSDSFEGTSSLYVQPGIEWTVYRQDTGLSSTNYGVRLATRQFINNDNQIDASYTADFVWSVAF